MSPNGYVSQVLTAPAYASLVSPLMTVVAYESGIDMPPDALASKAQVGPCHNLPAHSTW